MVFRGLGKTFLPLFIMVAWTFRWVLWHTAIWQWVKITFYFPWIFVTLEIRERRGGKGNERERESDYGINMLKMDVCVWMKTWRLSGQVDLKTSMQSVTLTCSLDNGFLPKNGLELKEINHFCSYLEWGISSNFTELWHTPFVLHIWMIPQIMYLVVY